MARVFWSKTVAIAAVAGAVLLCPCVRADEPAAQGAAFPVVPGYEELKAADKSDAATLGAVLLGELNCTACHVATEPAQVLKKGAPDLADIGARATPGWIRAYVKSPHTSKPGSTMPDLLHASDPAARDAAAEALTHYLVSLGGPMVAEGEAADDGREARGKALFHSVGCVACHAPEGVANPKIPSVPLGDLASKTSIEFLAEFLINPLKTRPASRMPNLGLQLGQARDIAAYLLRQQATATQGASAPPARTEGLHYAYYEADGLKSASAEVIDKLKPTRQGNASFVGLGAVKHRQDNFAIRFSGVVNIPRDGKYTFFIRSDDGTHVWIDGQEIIDNDGIHPPTEKSASLDLRAGDHEIVVTYFQAAGEEVLALMWEGPGLTRGFIPPSAMFSRGGRAMAPLNNNTTFKVDPEKAKAGQAMFSAIGCANCHVLPNQKADQSAKALAGVDLSSDTGCLGDHVAKGLPQYALNSDQKSAIKAALKDPAKLSTPASATDQVVQSMAAMNCYACHNRDGIGGPAADRAAFFVMSAPFDMGDEGRLPPRLTRVGAKLQQGAIEQIVFEGNLHVRPVLATRMPMFSKEKLSNLPELLAKADPSTDPAVQFNEVAARDGRQLVGNKGLGCVNCHGVGEMKSLGMPAPSLSPESQRLRTGWFHELLENPAHVNPGTRMPAFWDKGDVALPQLAGGTAKGQIDAIWSYLSLGAGMPLPAGLVPTGGYELAPTDQPIVYRTFMADVGSRAILVGFPEMVHVVFDANSVRLAKAWRGRFFDAKGMWDGRGGTLLGPLGTDVINLPAGPSFAILPSPDAPWPVVAAGQRNVGGQFKGYVLDKEERPIFRYILNGIDIQEQPLPIVRVKAPQLVRKFTVSSKELVKGLMFLAGTGDKIENTSPGVWTVDGKLTLNLSPNSLKPTVRTVAGKQQLLVPVDLSQGSSAFDVQMDW